MKKDKDKLEINPIAFVSTVSYETRFSGKQPVIHSVFSIIRGRIMLNVVPFLGKLFTEM